MSKKQFTLDSWLKDKSQKVVTRCGFPVRIVCTDVKRKDYPILALVERDDQEEYQSFTKDGRFSLYNPLHDNFDLFIETADEVSEDEKIKNKLINLVKMSNEVGGFALHKWEADEMLTWLDKQGETFPALSNSSNIGKDGQKPAEQQMYWTEEEIEPIISDYLCGREHYGGMIGRLCHLKPKQKQTEWGEDDEAFLDDILCKLEHDLILNKDEKDWLKSLHPQSKQEWSEEDEDYLFLLNSICKDAEEKYRNSPNVLVKKEIANARNWLKSLRPQNRWKPSDEHISLLQAIINDPNNASSESCQIVLKDILEQLKKLKEGKV